MDAPQAAMTATTGGARSVIVVTGLSGAGKSLTLKALEDMGYEAVDNLPLSLLARLAPEDGGPMRKPLAVGIDIRTRDFDAAALLRVVADLRQQGMTVRLLFLDADDDVLRRRYTETRRRHPLAADRPLMVGIALERDLVAPLKAEAEVVLDTSRLDPGRLRELLERNFAHDREPGLMIFLTSFGFRNGLPREADLVFDVRFFDNPHYVEDLRPLSGRDKAVADYVAGDADFAPFMTRLRELLEIALPRYAREGKSYLTIAVGCTGGRHRSVLVAEKLAEWLRGRGENVELRHRDLIELSPQEKSSGEGRSHGAVR